MPRILSMTSNPWLIMTSETLWRILQIPKKKQNHKWVIDAWNTGERKSFIWKDNSYKNTMENQMNEFKI